ncbi:MAG: hypothetical protein K8W52_36845 [Deltaproteobacteria bacterium]|nr:hypothetical protein [Deltaproteobacteria bacterium]
MSAFDKKPDDYDVPSAFASDGLGLPDPFHIPGTDWGVQPQFTPWMDDPSPYTPPAPEPQVPGGDPPSPPEWWKPQTPGPVPENPFTPEAQQKIKDKHKADDDARRQREQLMKELEDMAKQKSPDEKGDFPIPSGDTGNA